MEVYPSLTVVLYVSYRRHASQLSRTVEDYMEKKTLHASEQHREDVAEEREEWKQFQETFDLEKLVFSDETWTKTNMTPLRGRAEIGKRVIDYVPQGHWKTTTFLAALRHDGLMAPMVVDGAINGELFVAYVEQILLPTLKEGDIVVMDNLSSHKVAGVKKAIESVGARLVYLAALFGENFLNPHSPDNRYVPKRRYIRVNQSDQFTR